MNAQISLEELKRIATTFKGRELPMPLTPEFIFSLVEEIERLRATPIQWRPIDEEARKSTVLIKTDADEVDICVWRKSHRHWWNESQSYEDSEVVAHCPLAH